MKQCGRRWLTLIAVTIMTGGMAMAQTDTTQQLGLRDAVSIALEHNQQLINARLNVRQADAQVQEAWEVPPAQCPMRSRLALRR